MIRLEDISWNVAGFGLDSVRMEIPGGTYAILMGRTGSGKTTLLEIICGLRKPSRGKVFVAGREVTQEPPGKRGIGFVPQDGGLFPEMTVGRQIAFAPMLQGKSDGEQLAIVEELAGLTGVSHLLQRKPRGLSGGERQRIALARALAAKPAVLMLDEPLAALDEETHGDMMRLLKNCQQTQKLTVLHVTHNRRESEHLGELLLQLEDGHIVSQTQTNRSPET